MLSKRSLIALMVIGSFTTAHSAALAQDVAGQLAQMRASCHKTEQSSIAACNRPSASSAPSSGRFSEPSSGRFSEQRDAAIQDRGNSGAQCVAQAKQNTASCLAQVDQAERDLQNVRGRRNR